MLYCKVPPSAECVTAVQRMSTCSACQGLPDIQPCQGYCLNVMKGCLAYHYEINDSWNDYIGKWPSLFLSHKLIHLIFSRVPDESFRATRWTIQCGDDHRANQYQDLRCHHELPRVGLPGKQLSSFFLCGQYKNVIYS